MEKPERPKDTNVQKPNSVMMTGKHVARPVRLSALYKTSCSELPGGTACTMRVDKSYLPKLCRRRGLVIS